MMKCPDCGSKMIRARKAYRYTESGLDNVLLRGVKYFKCGCGETLVSIPQIAKLHELIGYEVIKKKSLLTGKEIRFLRKNMGLPAKKLAQYIGVDKATISRWENEAQTLSKSNDHLIRLIYSAIKDIPKETVKLLVEENFEEIKPGLSSAKFTIPWPNQLRPALFPPNLSKNIFYLSGWISPI